MPLSGVSQEVARSGGTHTDRRVREQQAKRPWGASECPRPGWLEQSVGRRKRKEMRPRRRGVGDRRWRSKVRLALRMLLRMRGEATGGRGGGTMLSDGREKQRFHNKQIKPR